MNCPYCLCDRSDLFCTTTDKRFAYVECSRCQSVYLSPRPTSDQMLAVVEESAASVQTHPDSTGHLRMTEAYRGTWEENLGLTFGDLGMSSLKPGRVLDIGCGNGFFLDWMKRKGWETHGIDLYVRDGLEHEITKGDIRDRKLAGQDFDLITMWDVLEHIPEPRQFLQATVSCMKPGGFLLIQSPCSGVIARAYRGDWRMLIVPHHCSLPSPSGLTEATHSAGLRLKGKITFGAGMGDTGQVPDRHRNAWNSIAKKLHVGDTVAVLLAKPGKDDDVSTQSFSG